MSGLTPNPTTPAYSDAEEWITAYFTIHSMSTNSRRYAWILWMLVGALFLLSVLIHWTGSHGGSLAAHWYKWAIRRRTWRGKHTMAAGRKYPIFLPPNGQLFCLAVLPTVALILAFVGPDYISPTIGLFDLPSSSLTARSTSVDQPQYSIYKAWWTSAGRNGIIAFALMPLCVLFAVKTPPFAIFALPFTTQTHFDKLAWLHRWSARLIWVITSLHSIMWSVQLSLDRRAGTGKIAYVYAWQYNKFIYGSVAFVLMTLVILLSVRPVRKAHYEAFYALHVILVPLTLVMSALHHPPIWHWCWVALAIWIGERSWRGTRWLYMNGIFGGISSSSQTASPEENSNYSSKRTDKLTYPPPSPYLFDPISSFSEGQLLAPAAAISYCPPTGYAHAEILSGATIRLTYITPGFLSWVPGQHFLINIPSVSRFTTHPFTAASICDEQAPNDSGRAIIFLIRSKKGWTFDLWDHVIGLSSRDEKLAPGEAPPKGTVMPNSGVLLRMYVDGPFGSSARARWGSHSTVLILVGGSGVSFGLSILEYVCLCLAGRDGRHLGGRPGGWGQKDYLTRRVRFVWLIREYAHIHWCASILRRCIAMIPSPALDVDIFVTNFRPAARAVPRQLSLPPPTHNYASDLLVGNNLAPPSPGFLHGGRSRPGSISESVETDSSGEDSEVDLNSHTDEYGDEERDIGDLGLAAQENYTIDLTEFEEDNDAALPGEDALNHRVMKVGKAYRANSRRLEKAAALKKKLDHGSTVRAVPAHRNADWKRHYRSGSGHSSTEGLLAYGSHRSRDSEEDFGKLKPGGLDVARSFQTSPLPSLSRPSPLHVIPTINTSTVSTPHQLLSPSPSTAQTWVTDTTLAESVYGYTYENNSFTPRLRVNDRELRDVSAIAGHARPGKPKIAKILHDEVQQAKGSTIVACCGPKSFNAMVRKAIAVEIDPPRIRRGDRRGYIDLVSEEFEF